MRTFFNANNELVLNVLIGDEIKSVTLDDLKKDTLGFCSGEMSLSAAYILETGTEKEFAEFVDDVLDEYIDDNGSIPELELFDLLTDFYCNLSFEDKDRSEAFEKKVELPVFVKIYDLNMNETERGVLRRSEDLNIMLLNHVKNHDRKGCLIIDYGAKSKRIAINDSYLKEMGI